MADTKHFDLLVIGSGPGGYVAAIRAAQLGMKTACVERTLLGGVCLNWGCIPSKALLHNAELYLHAVKHGKDWGIEIDPKNVMVNWEQVIGRSRSLPPMNQKGIAYLFKKNKIEHLEGHAKILSGASGKNPCKVEIAEAEDDYYRGGAKGKAKQTVTADKVLIATGAAPRDLPFAKFDGEKIISSYQAMNLQKQPKSMIIVGSGAIGMEFAYFYNAFGTEVTVIEMVDRILPIEDDDVSKAAEKVFKKQGMTFHTGHTLKEVKTSKTGVKATMVNVNDDKKTQELEAEVLLLAIGVKGRFDGLFDDKLDLKVEKDHIKTDYRDVEEPTYKTSVDGIYAIGDVIGPPWLAHVSMEEGVTCIERMAGHYTLGIDYDSIPGCTYCNPQIASIGLTERAAKEQKLDYKVGMYQLKAHGKALAVGATDGFVKLIVSKKYGEILGAHIFGEDASELIAEIALAKRLEATAEDIISTVHAHPTMHEAVHEAALATEDRMIHA